MTDGTRVVFDERAIADLLQSKHGPVARELVRRAVRVQNHAKRSIAHVGGGRVYKRGSVTHRASAPGEPPATDTGRLVSSITHDLGRDSRGLVARVGTDVEYALYLELGTRKMAPRPFLRPALAAERVRME